jgi:hypothetical protein
MVHPSTPPLTSSPFLGARPLQAASALVAVVVALVAAALLQSDADRVEASFASPPPLSDPRRLPSFVERSVVDRIANAATSGESYVIVEGSNGVGKSTAVLAAASRLSSARPVLLHKCSRGDTLLSVLHAMIGLNRDTGLDFVFIHLNVAKFGVEPRVDSLLLSRRPAREGGPPPPVLVLETAERLDVPVLKDCLDFAKELADAELGTFIFVFSPSDKFPEIEGFGSMSRAHIVDVGDLSESESIELLTRPAPGGANCSQERAEELFSVTRGHLPFLRSSQTKDFCRSSAAAHVGVEEVERGMLEGFRASVYGVDVDLAESGAACTTLCAVAHTMIIPGFPFRVAIAALFRRQLVRASLSQHRHVLTTALTRRFVDLACGCDAIFSRHAVLGGSSSLTLSGGGA